jgi:predicted nucleotidyltransferase
MGRLEVEAMMLKGAEVKLDGKGGRRRVAAARAIRVLRELRRLGVVAQVVGSLADGRFTTSSDVDFLVTECPPSRKYRIESLVEDIMHDIPFDVVYREEAKERILRRMESSAVDARTLMKVAE